MLQVGGVGVHDVDVLGVDRLQCRPVGSCSWTSDAVVTVPRPLTRATTGATIAAAGVVASLEVAVRRALGTTRRRRRRLGRDVDGSSGRQLRPTSPLLLSRYYLRTAAQFNVVDSRAHARHATPRTSVGTIFRRRRRRRWTGVDWRERCGGDGVLGERQRIAGVVDAVSIDDLAVLQLDAFHLAVQRSDLGHHVVAVRLSTGQRPRLDHAR